MATDIAAREASNFVEASKLSPEAVESTRAQFERIAQVTPGFHGPTDIDSLVGLAGTFLWPEDPFAVPVRAITFTFDSGTIGSQGRYTINSGPFAVESGIFNCVPNNPLIGFAALFLIPDGGAPSRPFFFAGIVVDTAGRITVALLNKVGPDGPINPPFAAVRIG